MKPINIPIIAIAISIILLSISDLRVKTNNNDNTVKKTYKYVIMEGVWDIISVWYWVNDYEITNDWWCVKYYDVWNERQKHYCGNFSIEEK